MRKMIKRVTVAGMIAVLLVVAFRVWWDMPPSQYNPRNIYLKLKGFGVNPWTPLSPGTAYRLTIWDVDWPIKWQSRYSYAEFVQHFVEEFKSRHPEVTLEIDYRLIPIPRYEATVADAVTSGHLPDVLAGPWSESLLYGGKLIPLNPFVSDVELALLNGPATAAVSYRGKLFAFPCWLEVRCAVANPTMLAERNLDVDEIAANGWTVEQFHKVAASAALDKSSAGTVVDLVWASERPVGEVSGVLQLVEELSKTPHKSFFDQFWNAETAVILPVGRGFLRHAIERSGLIAAREVSGVNYRLLPLPGSTDAGLVFPARLDAVCVPTSVVTDGESEGDMGRQKLACELAAEYARARAWAACELKTLPATMDGLPRWRLNSEVDERNAQFLLSTLSKLRIESTTPASPQAERKMLEALRGELGLSLLQGKVSAAQCVEALESAWYP